MSTATIIRVDWQAWAAAEARQRRVCGASAFVLSAELARVETPKKQPMLRDPDSEETLPGMGAWVRHE